MPQISANSPLAELDRLPSYPAGTSFGGDIDEAHRVLLSGASEERKRAVFLEWVARHQPCVFGRLATKGGRAARGLDLTVCWIGDDVLDAGAQAVAERIAADRRAWKLVAAEGLSSAFLVVFNSRRLAWAVPGPELRGVCAELAALYLTECAPIEADVIYTEAIPLRDRRGALRMFKGSVQLFHTGAHLRRHHDRRIPGGVMISVNGPGHYANSPVTQGLCADLAEAAPMVRRLAARSIGAGGLGDDRALSTTWHRECPGGRDAARWFSAAYHLDVLIQSGVVDDPSLRTGPCPAEQVWSWLHLDYIDARPTTAADRTHGWFHGIPVSDREIHINPWPPVVPVDAPDFNY
ncbi:hypothetical protein ACWDSJ_10530 [Nocardia sp. NPDC003482]